MDSPEVLDFLEAQVHEVQPDQQGPEEIRDRREALVHRALKANLDHRDLRGHQVHWVHLGQVAHQVVKDHVDRHQMYLDQADLRDLLDHPDHRANQDQTDRLDSQVLLDLQDNLEL